MGLGKLLGSISPLIGAMTGEGLFGQIFHPQDVEDDSKKPAGGMKRGGKVRKYDCGGKVKGMAKGGSASSRADGCAIRGKTRA